MFKKLLCKHSYNFYNTRIDYDFFGYGYYSFEFICPKCKKEIAISQREIDYLWKKFKSEYKKSVALGGEQIDSSKFSIPHYQDCDHLYISPVATLILRKYLECGIDLRQISNNDTQMAHNLSLIIKTDDNLSLK